jgi:hypothetical protein
MKTKRAGSDLPFKEKATGLEATKFYDGMVVTAEDLETASQYAVSLLQSVLRSYLGCGVVCGLGLNSITKLKGEPPWVVRVERGLAVDCHGFPIELTCPVDLDFNPDPCSPDELPEKAFIALRRITSDELISEPCGCSQHQTDGDCNRARDRVLVKAFTEEQLDDLHGGVCGHRKERNGGCREDRDGHDNPVPPGGVESKRAAAVTDWCAALKECSCSCDGDWVLLGTVELRTAVSGENQGIQNVSIEERRWVKPTQAYCSLWRYVAPAPEPDHGDRIAKLEELVERLRTEVAALTPPPPPVNG